MKKNLIFVLALITLSLFVFSEIKIGVINAQKVIQTTKKGKLVRSNLEKIGQEKQKKIVNMRQDIKNLEKELMSPALNSETKEKKAVDLQRKKTDLKRFIEDAQKDFSQNYQKVLMKLTKEIMPIIESIGKAKGFTLIFDLTNAGIAYFDRTIDITDEVIKAIDAKTK